MHNPSPCITVTLTPLPSSCTDPSPSPPISAQPLSFPCRNTPSSSPCQSHAAAAPRISINHPPGTLSPLHPPCITVCPAHPSPHAGVWVKHRGDEVKQRSQLNSPNSSASVVEDRQLGSSVNTLVPRQLGQ
ncbi:hypothetical protein AAC387_Pa03g0397 [Persea americana]